MTKEMDSRLHGNDSVATRRAGLELDNAGRDTWSQWTSAWPNVSKLNQGNSQVTEPVFKQGTYSTNMLTTSFFRVSTKPCSQILKKGRKVAERV